MANSAATVVEMLLAQADRMAPYRVVLDPIAGTVIVEACMTDAMNNESWRQIRLDQVLSIVLLHWMHTRAAPGGHAFIGTWACSATSEGHTYKKVVA